MRINKYLAACGVASRRKADTLIRSGQVQVNGQLIDKQGLDIDVLKDVVLVNGKRCILNSKHVYIFLNKPVGYVCTHASFRGEKSIFQLLPEDYQKLKIAGRLDKDSEGLLILSNDGDFIYQLTHPKYRHEKEYEIELDRILSKDNVSRLMRGIKLDEGIAKFDRLHKVSGSKYILVIHQGWKRQIKRMFAAVDMKVRYLKRVRENKLNLSNLDIGKYREVDRGDII